MRRKLTPQQVKLLRARIHQAQKLRILLKDVASEFGISKYTLRRYFYTHARAMSRKQYYTKERHDCECCGVSYDAHERCRVCTILIHSTGWFGDLRYGLKAEYRVCNRCIDTFNKP